VSALGQAAAHGVAAVRGDVQRLPFADGCADVVAAGEILEHVPDLRRTIAETARVLRPGGLIVLDTIADTALAQLVTVTLGERVVPRIRGLHDPALFVNRARLVAEYARHGVQLRLRGVLPSIRDVCVWLAGGAPRGRVRPIRSTAVLFQARGYKEAA
jgi:2-polyprenyl-6-hydroxyphenyl methylase/3-demethylubiquinone-9 3-methyltransferase